MRHVIKYLFSQAALGYIRLVAMPECVCLKDKAPRARLTSVFYSLHIPVHSPSHATWQDEVGLLDCVTWAASLDKVIIRLYYLTLVKPD
jgi:hypothetical protein